MTLWKGKPVLIIGAARQGMALARYLSNQGAKVILNDKRTAEQMKEQMSQLKESTLEWVLGDHPIALLDRVEMVCLSGGVPLTLPIVQEAIKRNMQLSNDTQIFMESVKAPVIGITGSAGKTTTTTLVGRMAKETTSSSSKVWVGGNIGLPLVEYLAEITPTDIVILEISSFQLEQMTISPHIAAVLNITPNHLDRHGTMQAYTTAKSRILAFQQKEDFAILNREDPGSWALRDMAKGKLISFGIHSPSRTEDGFFFENNSVCCRVNGKTTLLIPKEHIKLPGNAMLANVIAACAICYAAGIPFDAMNRGVTGFEGVEHRLEIVREWHGVTWVNDSIATAPERTLAALNAFNEPLVLLLGGRDKQLPWQDLSVKIHQRVNNVIIFGEAGDKISKAIGSPEPGDCLQGVTRSNSFEEALKLTTGIAKPGSVVLLSPGCTSFDAFRDFEERGNFFKKWVNELP